MRRPREDGTAYGWSDPSVAVRSNCPWGNTLGGFGVFGGGAWTQRTYDLLGIPHAAALISLDYLAIDSWDSESGYVEADGNILLYNTYYYYIGPADLCGITYLDRTDHVESVISHGNNALTLTITSTLDQDPYDESFGADNVLVMVR